MSGWSSAPCAALEKQLPTSYLPTYTIAVIPVYNESATIAEVVRYVADAGVSEVVVVDDHSQDGSGALAREMGATVIGMPQNIGAWGAIQAGLIYASRRNADCVVTLDGDGQHKPDDIKALVEPIITARANYAVGCFHQRGTGLERLARNLLRRISGLTVEDLTSGFRAYDRQTVKILLEPSTYHFDYQDIGVLLMLEAEGLKLEEVEVAMLDRAVGKSRIFGTWPRIFRYILSSVILGISKRR